MLELTLEGSTDDGAGSATIGYRTIEFRDIALGPSLGSGAFGQVRRGKWHNSNVAVKIMDYDKDSFEFIAREAKIMTLLGNHPNVIPFIGMAKEVDKIYLLTKMCHFGSLYDHFIKKKSTTTDVEFGKIVLQMCYGLDYLHLNQVIHRDVAARNYLFDVGQAVYVADFGMSRVLANREKVQATKTQEGPIRWMAPESLGEKKYSVKSDIYMFGIALWELLARETPFGDVKNVLDVYELVIKGERPGIPSDTPEPFQRIMTSCWETNPQDRMNLDDVMGIVRQYAGSLGCDQIELEKMQKLHHAFEIVYDQID